MAIKVYKSKTGVQRIGINVSSANQVASSYQNIANTFAQNSNKFFNEAAVQAKKTGEDIAMSTPVENIIGINPKTGQPQAYSLPDGFGSIAVESFRRIIDQRFYKNIEDNYKIKAKELADKNPLNLSAFQESFNDYTSKVVDNAEGKFKEFARNISEQQLKAYSATINNNIVQYNLSQAKQHNNDQNAELMEVAYTMGLDASRSDENTYAPFEYEQFVNYLNGWESNKYDLIQVGATNLKSVVEIKRKAIHEFLRGRLVTLLQTDKFAKSKLNSRYFQQSIKTLVPNPALGKDAVEYVLQLRRAGVREDDLKKIDSIINAEQEQKAELRDKIARDEANIVKNQSQLLEEEEEQGRRVETIDEEGTIQERIDSNYNSMSKNLNGGTLFQLDSTIDTFESIKEEVINARKRVDNPMDKTQANVFINEIDKKISDLTGQAFKVLVRDVASNYAGKSSEDIAKAKQHIINIFNGQRADVNILGENTQDSFEKLRIYEPNFANISNFSISQATNIFDAEIERMKSVELAYQKEQEAEAKRKKDNELNQKKINSFDRFNNEKNLILRSLAFGEGREETLVSSLIESIESDFKNGIITESEYQRRKNELQRDVSSKLVANLIKNSIQTQTDYPSASNIIDKIQEFILNPDAKIDLPQEIKDLYFKISSTYNLSDSDMRTYFSKVASFYKQNLNLYKENYGRLVKISDYASGKLRNADPDQINKALLDHAGTIDEAGNLRPADEQTYYTRNSIVTDLTLYGMIANNNVPSGLVNTLERIAESNITVDPDNSPLFKFLDNLRNFPVSGSNMFMDITPKSFYDNPKISKLLTVINLARITDGIGFGDLNTTIETLNKNIDNVEEITAEVFKGGFLHQAYNIKASAKSKREYIDKRIVDALDIDTRFTRGTNGDFFKIIDSELPALLAIGFIKNEDDFNAYVKNRFTERMELSNEVFNDPNSISENNFVSIGLKKLIPSEKIRDEVIDEMIFDNIIPYWQEFFAEVQAQQDARGELDVDTTFEPSPPVPDGFKIRFGNKIFASQPDASDDNIIDIRLTPRVEIGNSPEEIVMETEAGFNYRGVSLMEQMMTGYNVFFKFPDYNNYIPLGNRKFETDLDVYSQHHYKNIANGNFVRNNDGTISTVLASTFEIGTESERTFILLPLVFDGKVYPTETPDQIQQLFERAAKEQPLEKYLLGSSEMELNTQYLEEIKSTWEDIGTDAEKANEILGQFQPYNDVMTLDVVGMTNKYYRLAAEEQYKQILSDYLIRQGATSLEEADKFLTEKVIHRARKKFEKRRLLKDYPISNIDIKGVSTTGDFLLPQSDDSILLPELKITKDKILEDLFDNGVLKTFKD